VCPTQRADAASPLPHARGVHPLLYALAARPLLHTRAVHPPPGGVSGATVTGGAFLSTEYGIAIDTDAPAGRMRLDLVERAIAYEMLVAEEIYMRNGADLDIALGRLSDRICFPQSERDKSTAEAFRNNRRTAEQLTKKFLKGMRDDVRRITTNRDYNLASWDDVLAEGEYDDDELAPLPESGQRNGALPCELLYNGGPTRINIFQVSGWRQSDIGYIVQLCYLTLYTVGVLRIPLNPSRLPRPELCSGVALNVTTAPVISLYTRNV
jgi:hypothetical protein